MIAFLQAQAHSAWRGWEYFWFDSRSDSRLLPLGLFRICFGSVMLFFYFTRHLDLDLFYGENGVLPVSHLLSMENLTWRPTIFRYVTSPLALQAAHGLFLLALLSLTVGWRTRSSAIVVFVTHLMFINRNPAVMFGVDTIGTFFLLYLCFANSGARLSLDQRAGRGESHHSTTSHIAWRLMQLQVCVVYTFSGVEKLKGIRWWDGSALWDVLSIGNMQRFDLSFVAHVPVLLAGSVYLLLLWEIYFAALVWVPKLRLPMLAFGVFLHLGIWIFMNLPTFGFMMMANYVLFLTESEARVLLAKLPFGSRYSLAASTRS